ncbi:hypothetical protein L1276_002067 [Flavobacterium sp. HSC-32F16]|uniref:energy transducer TonB n=1 Tax=Flavobacterium sp. HSC-32F16 TaxID=2910964 RepID=UPI0020A60E33|nr:energy transducer TonB [Flavobacterium sp. HSC-32F16]MCP2026923.1 hypothetical protein [Flavobacterium sp. HSC-32F16]
MNQKFKITISTPCQEDWDKMTPNKNGRFCMSCSKTVIDFSIMSNDEIQHFFGKNQDKNICGRFKNEQLDSLIIQIPGHILYTQNQYHKIFLLALFIVMGTTLFSCQDKDGNKTKIDKIEVVHDSIKMAVNKDTFKTNTDKKPIYPKYEETIYGEPDPISGNYVENPINYTAGGIGVYELPPKSLAHPADGVLDFYNCIKDEFVMPRKARKTTGEILASFSIEKDGTFENIKILSDIGNETGDELTRVLENSPKWVPADIDGEKITAYYKLSVTIQKDSLNEKRRKRKFSKITSFEIQEIQNPNEI